MKSAAWCICPSARPATIFTAAIGPAIICSPNHWCAWTPRPARAKWHFQIVHHGLWDYDLASPPMLVTITVDGNKIDAVVQLTKEGFAFVFDRVTGKPVWPIEERPVPQERCSRRSTHRPRSRFRPSRRPTVRKA